MDRVVNFLAILNWKFRRDWSDGNALEIEVNSRWRLFADVWIGSQTHQKDFCCRLKYGIHKKKWRPFRINWARIRCGHAITVLFITQLAFFFWVLRTLLDSLASFLLWGHCHFGDAHKLVKRVANFFIILFAMIFLGYFILIDKEWNSYFIIW